jgi:archaellum biogenesis ATPase FlaH
MRYKFESTYKLTKAGIDIIRQANSVVLSVVSPKMFEETVIVAFEHLHDGIITLTMKQSERNKYQRFIRVKKSPISGYSTDEVRYEIVENRPRLVSSSSEQT